MVESEKSREPLLNKDLTPEQAFLAILGRDKMPATPEDMPDVFKLPPEVLGNFESSVLSTMVDKRERSQSVLWNKGYGVGISPVAVGTTDTTGFDSIVDNSWLFVLAHLSPRFKALLHYHTHRDRYLRPSEHDAIEFGSSPKLGFMELIGSDNGIVAMVQTQQALSTKYQKTYLNDIVTGIEVSNLEYIATRLAKAGIAYYLWQSPSGTVERGSLQHGITLRRIKSEKI